MAEPAITEERRALIVGASRGLGLGLAESLHDRDWRVVATVRKSSPDHENLRLQGVRIETVDIDDDASVAALRQRLGSEKFDLVFVVAGVATESDKPLHAVSRAVSAQVYLTNAVSPILFAEAFADRIAPGGTLAFMSSILGSVALNEDGGWENYRASKAALNTNARSFAVRHAERDYGILLLHPGWVRTDMGGAEADLDVGTSVAGMVTVIEAFAGRRDVAYLDYRGETLAW
ncbi:NAD(P)-dependent dehydrogenase (short-subunit alcohol dehydrogenase family) [Methylorubrum rhodinum]|uniref:NAD(P)-dependent dehydrogenase (Short-subunit alcohol dehydrogenase family) n=1 Tax=Methylorubrum rhodinum TaxID=29428 RepID=A0A840ZMS5_9HYPH|nr:SDR family oxidoreductase [Methylorubrum rhodinum]MBB5758073.1 NAD(P)-dependent dehydrogenase (short-subunit alcohol dehydrogenase family) [Methylorubrum rhodinum]